jgi:hypothetical protein
MTAKPVLRTNAIESEILSDKLSNGFRTTRPRAKGAGWLERIGIVRQQGDELSTGPRRGSDGEQASSEGVRGRARDGRLAGVNGGEGAGLLDRCGTGKQARPAGCLHCSAAAVVLARRKLNASWHKAARRGAELAGSDGG